MATTTIQSSSASKVNTSMENRMPPEWAPHKRTLMSFPTLVGTYGNPSSLQAAREEVASIANAVAEFEPVWLYASPSAASIAQSMVRGDVAVKELEVDDLWMRDLGPVFVRRDGSKTTNAAVDFNFNHWGSKTKSALNPTFARRMLETQFPAVTRHPANLVSEGGALEIDGEGTLLVTDSSIINDNRNPSTSKETIEVELKRLLGVSKVLWLKGVKDLESTDWHVDAFARFVEPGHVVLSKPPMNAHPALLQIYDAALSTFQSVADAAGRLIKVTICQEPDHDKLPGGSSDGMCTSYVNYLLVNGGIVIPKFGLKETDEAAAELLKALFPGRKVRQVYINELPRLGGGIHCSTQHVPE